MSSTSRTKPSYVLNDSLPVGGGFFMGVVANSKMNEAQAAANDAAPVAPNFLNFALADGDSLSM